MRTNRNLLVLMLLGVNWLISCEQDQPIESVTCNPVTAVTSQNACYDPSRGLTLVASGQTSSPDRGQFVWSVFPQKDTTLNNNIAARLEKVLIGSETIVVPDSLLINSPKFIIIVRTTGCEGKKVESMYYSFVRRQSAGTNCAVWQKQNL